MLNKHENSMFCTYVSIVDMTMKELFCLLSKCKNIVSC